nr:hypothetical protein [Paramuribaculum sp.]
MEKKEHILDLRRLWRAMKKLRWLYVASMVGFMILGCAYWYVAMPVYKASGMMLVEDPDSGGGGMGMAGGMGQMMKTFSIGGFGGAAVDNEMLIAGSHDVAMRVVRNLKLNRTYTSRVDGEKSVLFNNSPISVEAPAEYFDTLSVALKVRVQLNEDGKADVKVTKGLLGRTVGEAKNVELPVTVNTKYGDLQILKTASFVGSPYRDVKVSVIGNEAACKLLAKQLMIDVATKLGDAILVECNAQNRNLGMAVVNAVMKEYNLKRLGRTHQKAAEEIEYYDGRIAELLTQLTDAEKKVADFQSENGVFNDAGMASMLLGASFRAHMSNIEAQTTLNYYENVLAALRADAGNETLIPSIPLTDNEGKSVYTDENVTVYNEAVLERMKLAKSATADNAALKNLDEQLNKLRLLVIENSEKMIAKAKNDLRGRANVAGNASDKLSMLPQKGLKYASLMRDKEFKSQTYAFLLQGREQAVLQLYSTAALGFVFEEAYCDIKPDNTMKIIVFLICIIMGFICPSCLALVVMLRDDKVSDTMDVASLGVEGRTVIFDSSKAQTNKLRGVLLDNSDRKLVYLMSLSCNGSVVANALSDALGAIDKKVVIMPEVVDNDALLSAERAKDMSVAMANG